MDMDELHDIVADDNDITSDTNSDAGSLVGLDCENSSDCGSSNSCLQIDYANGSKSYLCYPEDRPRCNCPIDCEGDIIMDCYVIGDVFRPDSGLCLSEEESRRICSRPDATPQKFYCVSGLLVAQDCE